jgi:DNA-binding NarL/FixJ family response regulator
MLRIAGNLTKREKDVLACLGQGYTDKEIAAHLELSLATARSYVANLMKKTGKNRHQLGILGHLRGRLTQVAAIAALVFVTWLQSFDVLST